MNPPPEPSPAYALSAPSSRFPPARILSTAWVDLPLGGARREEDLISESKNSAGRAFARANSKPALPHGNETLIQRTGTSALPSTHRHSELLTRSLRVQRTKEQ